MDKERFKFVVDNTPGRLQKFYTIKDNQVIVIALITPVVIMTRFEINSENELSLLHTFLSNAIECVSFKDTFKDYLIF